MAAMTTAALHAALCRMLAKRSGDRLTHWKNNQDVFSLHSLDKHTPGLVSYAVASSTRELNKDLMLDLWDRYPKKQWIDVEATLEAITSGLIQRARLASSDGTTRAQLELYVCDVLECPQPLSVEIVAYLRIAASDGLVFQGDGGGEDVDPDVVNSLDEMYCVESAEDAAVTVMGSLDSFFSESVYYDDDDGDYARGTNTTECVRLEKELANDLRELGELITEPARDFLPAAEAAYYLRKQAEDEAAYDAEDGGGMVITDDTKECDVEPTAIALLCKEISQDVRTDLVFDDRALKVLYDAGVHFVEGLMGAASRVASKRGPDAEASVDDVAVATPAYLKIRKADYACGQKRRVRRVPMPARLICQPELPPVV